MNDYDKHHVPAKRYELIELLLKKHPEWNIRNMRKKQLYAIWFRECEKGGERDDRENTDAKDKVTSRLSENS
jgi:hypothetical protein